MRKRLFQRLRVILGEARLPREDRRAARAERQAEETMRAQREWRDEGALQRAAAEAERRRGTSRDGRAYRGGHHQREVTKRAPSAQKSAASFSIA